MDESFLWEDNHSVRRNKSPQPLLFSMKLGNQIGIKQKMPQNLQWEEKLSFHVTSGSMFRSYSNCQVIPQSTCSSFAVFFISSLHLIPCLQLGKYPALLKKKKKINVYLSRTPPAPLISFVWIAG